MQRKSKYNVGQEFPNKKRLVELVGSHPKFRTSMWMWECCSCNKKYGPSLISSITRLDKLPKCCFMPKGNKTGRWLGHEEIAGVFLGSYKYNALKRGHEWNVSVEYLWKLWLDQDGKCVYTDRQLVHGKDASLDRIDSSFGYVVGNVQWVHADVNRMKSNFTEDYFLNICEEIVKNKLCKSKID
jgi:hypothetical protein